MSTEQPRERPTNVTVPLAADDLASLDELSAAAGTSKAGWLRSAVETARDDATVRRRIARNADTGATHGGPRPGSGRKAVQPETQKNQAGRPRRKAQR
jgi:hypothetical protein